MTLVEPRRWEMMWSLGYQPWSAGATSWDALRCLGYHMDLLEWR